LEVAGIAKYPKKHAKKPFIGKVSFEIPPIIPPNALARGGLWRSVYGQASASVADPMLPVAPVKNITFLVLRATLTPICMHLIEFND
jgi:hypothetical protein